jgi:hypothetical protein
MKITRQLAVMLALGAIVALLVLFGPSACRSLFTAKKQAEVARGQEKAAIGSGAEAMNTVSGVEQNTAAIETTTKEKSDEVKAAPAGDSNDAADRAVCGMRSYRNSERCARLRSAGPGVPAGGNAPR